MKLSAIQIADWEPSKTLVFGDSKTGKSTLAGYLADRYILDWFDLENGHKVLRKLTPAQQANINLFRIPATKVWPIAIETITKIVNGDKGKICVVHGKMTCNICTKQNNPDYPQEEFCLRESYGKDRILVIDSGTQLGISALNRIISGQPDDFKAGWEEYRTQGSMLDGVYSQIQQAWYNVIVICHTTQARMEDAQKTKLVPVSGTDNYSRNLAKFFDHVVYCDIGTGEHKFGSGTTYRPQVLTGSRTDITIEAMEKPALLPFFDGTIGKPGTGKTGGGSNTTAVLNAALAKVAGLK